MLPGFTAESALQRSSRCYRGASTPLTGGPAGHRVVPQDRGVGAIGGAYLGQGCVDHVTYDVYVDLAADGYTITGIHSMAVGSC